MHSQGKLDRATAEEMLRALLAHVRHVLGESSADVRNLIHPNAEMRLLVGYRRLLIGRGAAIDALERGRAAVVFKTSDIRFEWVDETTVLAFARARYSLEDGTIVERDVCWLNEFRDGLVWRVQAFDNEDAARQALGGD